MCNHPRRSLPFLSLFFCLGGEMLTLRRVCRHMYYTDFLGGCSGSNIVLNPVDVTARPTGFSSTGDPLSPFEAPTPTPGETVAVTAVVNPPLIPTDTSQSGSASGLDAFWALGTSTVVAIAVAVLIDYMQGM